MADVVVSRRTAEVIRRGHPWLYRDSLSRSVARSLAQARSSAPRGRQDHHRDAGELETGSVVRLVLEDGSPLGVGVWDTESPIAVRVWSLDARTRIDGATFRSRLDAALAIRGRLFQDGRTTAYRILNGEGDRTPGFVLDRYGDVAVLRIDGAAARVLADRVLDAAEAPLRAAGVTTLLDRVSSRGKPPVITARFGAMREKIEVREHGVPFVVDLAHGQKTGAFLDQRENRRRVGELVARHARHAEAAASPVRVLNLFSYTGGFSLRAALAGGAVTSVDVAMAAHATAQESFRLAGVDPKGHAFVTADAFAWLTEAKRRGNQFDVIISDPPSFAPSEKAKAKGIAAYRSLHRACVDLLAPRGTFVAASCSSHVAAEEFVGTLDDAALGRSDLRLLELYGPPADHPTLPIFSEGRYLKLAVLQ